MPEPSPQITRPTNNSTIPCDDLTAKVVVDTTGTYTLDVVDENGGVVATSGPIPLTANANAQVITIQGMGLSPSAKHFVRLTIIVDGIPFSSTVHVTSAAG